MASAELAYTMGSYHSHYDNPGSAPADGGGRYVAVWRRQTGNWRIVVLSAHYHEPLPNVP